MDTEASELNLGALLPDMSTVVGWIELAFRLAVMAGPILMLGFGLVYLLKPPAEANYGLGYRFWWGMSSLDAWKYTQRLAGRVWSIAGGALTVILAVVCCFFRDMDPLDMASLAGILVLCELVIIAVICIVINVIVMRKFDKDGYLREETNE